MEKFGKIAVALGALIPSISQAISTVSISVASTAVAVSGKVGSVAPAVANVATPENMTAFQQFLHNNPGVAFAGFSVILGAGPVALLLLAAKNFEDSVNYRNEGRVVEPEVKPDVKKVNWGEKLQSFLSRRTDDSTASISQNSGKSLKNN